MGVRNSSYIGTYVTREMKLDAFRNRKCNFTPMNTVYAEIKNTLPVAMIGKHYTAKLKVGVVE